MPRSSMNKMKAKNDCREEMEELFYCLPHKFSLQLVTSFQTVLIIAVHACL